MEFHVLGPLEVSDDGRPVAITAPRQRALLAVLLAHANEVVSTDRLLDLVWGDESPDVSALRYQVSKLREALGDPDVIVTKAPGYVLLATGDELDAQRFEALAAGARAVLETDPSAALAQLDEALGLWRGDPYAEFSYEEFARLEILRLEERRLEAIESRFDALLAMGRDRDLVGELQVLVDEHPRRERLTAALMLALYRSGRQADALAAYQSLRTELGESLGIEPSAELVELEGRILLQDDALVVDASPPPAEYLRGYVLRGRIGEGAHGVVWRAAQPGVGREVAIKAIDPDIANRPGFVRRFEMEAQLVASLEHPHIVSLFDFWRDPEGAYLVMPYLRGGNLAQLLSAGPIDTDRAIELIRDIGDALSYAHRRGVVHRDVTPQNVLLDDEDHPYLADFGVAALIGEIGSASSSSPAYLAPEQHAGRAAVPESDIYSMGVLAHSVLTGEIPTVDQHLRPVSQLNPSIPAGVDDVIARATALEVSERFMEPTALAASIAAAIDGGSAVRHDVSRETRNPYKGLRAFGEADAPDFFGRDIALSELVDAVARHRLVAVVGPSGCGKSSLVRAGLVADLRQGAVPGSERWLISDMYPGSRPLDELGEALLRVAVTRPEDLVERLAREDIGDVLGGLLPRGSELLLLVDQFEELFTQTVGEDERVQFLDILTRLATDHAYRVRVLVTLRADFFDRPLGYAGFGDLIRRGMVPLTVPSIESMVQAIVGPAESAGLRVEPGLERVITGDVTDQPGGLPLLEFALAELFQERDGRELTAAGYQRTGGVLGALGRRADDLYVTCDDAGRDAIKQVFLRLVTVEDGAEATRRRIPLNELQEMGIEPGALEQVLDDFGAHRLITFDRDPETRAPTVEVAHEALLSKWDRLRSWIDVRRDDLLLHRRLATSVSEWQESGQGDAYQLSGGRLEHYELFATETDLALTESERDFLQASRQAEDEASAKQKRRRLAVLAGFAVAAVIALVLAGIALRNQRAAEQEAAINRARVLTAQSIDAIGTDDQLALLLALEAADVSAFANGEVLPETTDALHRAVAASRLEAVIPLAGFSLDQSVGLAVSSDGLVALTATGDTVELRPVNDLQTVVTVLGTPVEPVESAFGAATPAFNPSGRHVATVGSDGAVHVWDVESRSELWSQFGHEGEPGAAEFSPDGAHLVTIGGGSLVMWDAATGAQLWSMPAAGGGVTAFSVDGTRVAVGSWLDGSVALLDVSSGIEAVTADIGSSVGGLAWNPDGSQLLAGLEIGDIAVLDGSTLDIVDTWKGHGRTPSTITIDASGTRLATGSDDGTTRIWDLSNGNPLVVLTGSAGETAFLPDGDHLLTAADDASLMLYNITTAGRGETLVASLGGASHGIDFSPDGAKVVALATESDTGPAWATIWDILAATPILTVDSLDWFAFDGVSFANDGNTFAVQDWDDSIEDPDTAGPGWGPVRLRDASSGEPVIAFSETEGQERQALVFSQDGTLLATGSTNSFYAPPEGHVATASVHDVATGELLHRLDHEDWAVTGVAISPNGDRLSTATCGPGRVAMWDLALESKIWSVDYPGCSTGLAFSPDGLFVVASSYDGPPAVWDGGTGELRFEIAGHNGGALSVAVSPDGRMIASAGTDGSVLIVDSDTGEVSSRFHLSDAGIGDVDFSPDGNSLAATTATTDGSLFVLVLDPHQLVELARERVLRSLTASECAAYEIDPCPADS